MLRKPITETLLPLISRRKFVKSAAATALTTASLAAIPVRADDLPKVDEQSAMAKALGYVHDAQTVDAAKRFSDRYCNNCALYAGAPDEDWAACSIFPGKVVAGRGWCSAWAPKPKS